MKTLDVIIRESREYVCEHWGQDEACVIFYAPLTRMDGITWMHPAWAREYTWREITLRADRVWRITGSFWNPLAFTLIWNSGSEGIYQEIRNSEKRKEGWMELGSQESRKGRESGTHELGGGSRSPSAIERSQP